MNRRDFLGFTGIGNASEKLLNYLMIAGLMMLSVTAQAMDFKAQKVTQGIYAYIGPLTDRTPQNLGLNNNIGFIDTHKGWVLVDSGAGDAAAKKLEAIAKGIKNQPIIAVINLGSQDHRWMGNDYFSKRGAKIYAYKGTVKTESRMFNQEVDNLVKKVPAEKGVKMKTADIVLAKKSNTLTIGGVKMQLNFYGDGHFPGDCALWLPKQKVLFGGDLIYVDRILLIHPWSNPITWNKAYQTMRHLPAKFIVPGHGRITDWKQADAETGVYLKKLNQTMKAEAENMAGVTDAASKNKDWPAFRHLKHYNSLHPINLNRTYLKWEANL